MPFEVRQHLRQRSRRRAIERQRSTSRASEPAFRRAAGSRLADAAQHGTQHHLLRVGLLPLSRIALQLRRQLRREECEHLTNLSPWRAINIPPERSRAPNSCVWKYLAQPLCNDIFRGVVQAISLIRKDLCTPLPPGGGTLRRSPLTIPLTRSHTLDIFKGLHD